MSSDKEPFGVEDAPGARRPGLIRREVLEAQQEAAHIVETARGEAATILRAAREEAAALLAESAARGHSEGLARITDIVARFEAERAAFLAAQEPTILRLALAAARKLLADAFRDDTASYRGLVEDTIGRFPCGGTTEVHVHPGDAPEAERIVAAAIAQGDAQRRLVLVADPGIEPHGVRLVSALGTVDASLSLHLAAIARAWQCPGDNEGAGKP